MAERRHQRAALARAIVQARKAEAERLENQMTDIQACVGWAEDSPNDAAKAAVLMDAAARIVLQYRQERVGVTEVTGQRRLGRELVHDLGAILMAMEVGYMGLLAEVGAE